MMIAHPPDICRFCKCTGDECTLADGDKCVWFDKTRTVCNAPSCIRAFEALKARTPKPKRRTSADIHALICGRKKKKKAA